MHAISQWLALCERAAGSKTEARPSWHGISDRPILADRRRLTLSGGGVSFQAMEHVSA